MRLAQRHQVLCQMRGPAAPPPPVASVATYTAHCIPCALDDRLCNLHHVDSMHRPIGFPLSPNTLVPLQSAPDYFWTGPIIFSTNGLLQAASASKASCHCLTHGQNTTASASPCALGTVMGSKRPLGCSRPKRVNNGCPQPFTHRGWSLITFGIHHFRHYLVCIHAAAAQRHRSTQDPKRGHKTNEVNEIDPPPLFPRQEHPELA